MSRTADVVIIGGGIVGASIAYHLTRQGRTRVLILERECVQGFGSTGRATGGVRAQFSTPINIHLSLYSIEFFRHFYELTGVNPEYRPNGYLFLALCEKDLASLKDLVSIQQGEGLREVCLVNREDVQKIVPQLFTEDVVGASYCSIDGFVEPLNLLRGFTKKAQEVGTQVLLGTEVRKLEITAGAVSGVITNNEHISTRCVVNAAGAWASGVAAMAGVALPVLPSRRHVAGTQFFSAIADDAPMVIELGSSFHFRKDHDTGGILLLWNDSQEEYGEKSTFNMAWLQKMLPMAHHRLPALEHIDLSPRRCWVGLYEVSPDRHPILGKVPGTEGLFLANGFSGHGVMHSPATGRLLAEMILQGKTSLMDVSTLSIERFERGALFEESGVL